MKPHYICAILAAASFSVLGCKGDPTADLRGGPTLLDVNPKFAFFNSGDAKPVEVIIRDAQLNPLSGDVTATSADGAVATVVLDTTRLSPDNSFHFFVVTAVGASGDSTFIRFAGGGLKDSTQVFVQ
ncbi:MAG TPA: hypothetical protein VFK78_00670 [Gemmatimonadales bacterium]|nr:hypothetical protein [Gemmatimonadales bacterium]